MATGIIKDAATQPLSSTELIKKWDFISEKPDERSLLSRLCLECVAVIKQLILSTSVKDRVAPLVFRCLDRSRCTLVLWTDAHRVADGGLDDATDSSPYLKRMILQILCRLARALSEKLLPKLKLHNKFATDQLDSWRQEALTAIQVQLESKDREPYDSASDSDDSDSDSSVFTEVEDIVESLETDTQLLMDLDRFIEVPSIMISSNRQTDAQIVPEWKPQDTFAQIIRTRFPHAIEQIIESLALANLWRLKRCAEAREMSANNPETEGPTVVNISAPTIGGKTQEDSGYGTMMASSACAASKLAESRYAETVMSYAAGDHTIKIPPLPPGAKEGRPFDCVACGKIVSFTRSKMWKRHLFNDLRPWTCIEPDCATEGNTFDTRENWVQHLEFDHEYGPDWMPRSCSLCMEMIGEGVDACSKHIAAHLEEISLATLPRPIGDDDVSQISVSSNPSKHACDFDGCGQVFDHQHQLNQHIYSHSTSYQCHHEGCNEGFATVKDLDMHTSIKHDGIFESFWQWQHCAVDDCEYSREGGKRFSRKDKWRRHCLEVHGDLTNSSHASLDSRLSPMPASSTPPGYPFPEQKISEPQKNLQLQPETDEGNRRKGTNSSEERDESTLGQPESIRFIDAVGRRFILPLEKYRTWDQMNSFVHKLFEKAKHLSSAVREGRYNIVGLDDEILLPSVWEKAIQPGSLIEMRFWSIEDRKALSGALGDWGSDCESSEDTTQSLGVNSRESRTDTGAKEPMVALTHNEVDLEPRIENMMKSTPSKAEGGLGKKVQGMEEHQKTSNQRQEESFEPHLTGGHGAQPSSYQPYYLPPITGIPYDEYPRNKQSTSDPVSYFFSTTQWTPVTKRLRKAKKGLPVHECDICQPPKNFTRAEHLRRHQLMHNPPNLACSFAGCERLFHREDLLKRHEQRHQQVQEQLVPNVADEPWAPGSGVQADPSILTTFTNPSMLEPTKPSNCDASLGHESMISGGSSVPLLYPRTPTGDPSESDIANVTVRHAYIEHVSHEEGSDIEGYENPRTNAASGDTLSNRHHQNAYESA